MCWMAGTWRDCPPLYRWFVLRSIVSLIASFTNCHNKLQSQSEERQLVRAQAALHVPHIFRLRGHVAAEWL